MPSGIYNREIKGYIAKRVVYVYLQAKNARDKARAG